MNKRQITKKHALLSLISELFVILCHFICVCNNSEHVSAMDIWRLLLFESRCSTDRNAFSFSSYDWRYQTNDSATYI